MGERASAKYLSFKPSELGLFVFFPPINYLIAFQAKRNPVYSRRNIIISS